MNNLRGISVRVDEHAMTRVFVYPKWRFWEFDPSPETERWCAFFGFGHYEYRPGCFQVDDVFVMHPTIWEAIKKGAK